MVLALIRFLLDTFLIVVICKYVLVKYLRKLAEVLNLKAKTVGNIAGIATSIPELLTVSFSAFTGYIQTGLYNILSSNTINLILYSISILAHKNGKLIRQNRGLQIEILLAMITILIPIVMLVGKVETSFVLVPFLLLLYGIIRVIDQKAHKKYLEQEETELLEEIQQEEKKVQQTEQKKGWLYGGIIVVVMVILFFIGNHLSDVLEELAGKFHLPEFLLGALLGFATSIPELMTFFEAQSFHQEEDEKLGVVEATNNLLASNILCLCIIQSIGIIIFTIVKH